MKEIKTVALVGLGAIGAYFADRLQPGARRRSACHRRRCACGADPPARALVINGKQEYYHVVEPGEGEPAIW